MNDGIDSGAPKIVHVVWSFAAGGIECRLVEQLNARPANLEQHLVVINHRIEEPLLRELGQHIRVHRIGRRPGSRSPMPIARLNMLLSKLNPDIVVCHSASIARSIMVKPRKLVLHMHNVHEPLRGSAPAFDAFIAVSNEAANHIVRALPSARPVVINDGVRCDDICPRFESVPHEVFRIVQVGRLEPFKGQDILLHALEIVRHRRPDLLFSSHFIGDGSQRAHLEDLAGRLWLDVQVQFLGPQTSEFVHENLHRYDLLVLPSRSEGLGDAAIEAAFARVPVLAAALPGPMEVIDCGDCGWAFRPGDAADCASGILDVVEAYRNQNVAGFIERAFVRAEERYSLPVATDRLAAFYSGLAGLARPSTAPQMALGASPCATG